MIRARLDILLGLLLALCLLFGGSSAGGLLSNLLLQLISILVLVAAFSLRRGPWIGAKQPLLTLSVGLGFVITILQFIPLPAALWTMLPGREMALRGFELLGFSPGWEPLSIAPYNSAASIAWLFPAMATGYLAAKLLDFRTDIVAIVCALIALASIPLASVQIAQGADSGWYFYAISSYGQGAGFFANGNHQATFLLITMTFVSALHASRMAQAKMPSPLERALYALVMLILTIGVLLAGSLAGIGLLIVVLPACIVLTTPRIPVPSTPVLGLIAAGTLAVIVFLSTVSTSIIASSLAAEGPNSRWGIANTMLEAIWEYFPFGSGVGTFNDIYRMFEDPSLVGTTFVNHAHNEYLEILLETGLLGGIAVAVFIVWWARRTLQIWQRDRDNFYGLAGSIVVGTVLVHSLVDYPLRTAAVSALFALSIALMIRPAALWAPKRKSRSRSSRQKTPIKL